jgi:hypothetical protein
MASFAIFSRALLTTRPESSYGILCHLQPSSYNYSAGILTAVTRLEYSAPNSQLTKLRLQFCYQIYIARGLGRFYCWVTWCLPRARPPYCLRHPRNTSCCASCCVYRAVPLRACPCRCGCKRTLLLLTLLTHSEHVTIYYLILIGRQFLP